MMMMMMMIRMSLLSSIHLHLLFVVLIEQPCPCPCHDKVFLFNNTHESSCYFEPLIITADQRKFIAWNFQSKEELRSKVGKGRV
jgi:hypothetical protein